MVGDMNARVGEEKVNDKTKVTMEWAEEREMGRIEPIYDSVRATYKGGWAVGL